MAKIVFLGTAGDSKLIFKGANSAGIRIQVDDKELHIDPGPGALLKCKQSGFDVRKTDAVLISSPNYVYSNDVNVLLSAMTNDGKINRGMLVASLFSTEESDDYSSVVNKHYKKAVSKFLALESEMKINLEDIEIIGLRTNVERSIGFKIRTKDFILSYTGESKYSKDLADQYKNSDIIIFNVKSPSNKKSELLGTEDIIKILEKVKPELAVLTGFSEEYLEAGILEEARLIKKETKVQVIAASDGLVLSPKDYSAESKQKMLGSFK